MDRDAPDDTHSATLTTSERLFTQAIKPRDLPAFYALQERNQERIRLLLQAFESIAKAPTLTLGYEMAAAQCRKQRGFTPGMLRKLYGWWRQTQDWRELVDEALECGASKLNVEFTEWLNEQVDANGRSMEAALRKVRSQWTKGEHIPGYGTWKEWWQRTHPGRPLPRLAPPHPHGWTTRNLRRKLDESKFRRVAQTQGLTAAKHFKPGMKRTRVGVRVGQFVQFDDLEHDFFANTFKHHQAARPLELFAHDYAAAYKTFWGIKPKYKDDEGFVKKLSGDMMRLVVGGHFFTHGYLPEIGTTCIAEHGTACFSEEMKRDLHDATGGMIIVQESGFDGRAPHAGLYHGRPRGQPGHKASLEASNRLVHAMTGDFPGQTGTSVEMRPENLHGALTHNAQLLAASEWLPEPYKELLDYPFLEIGKAQRKLSEVYHEIACERDHRLEGWQECGHIIQSLDFLGTLMTEDDIRALPEDRKKKALAMINGGMIETRPVLMSRWEVWKSGRKHLVPIDGGTLCKILGEPFMQLREVNRHQLIIRSEWLMHDEVAFWGHVITPENTRHELREGGTYQVFVNPFLPEQIFVRDHKGRYLGISEKQPLPTRGDAAAEADAILRYAKEENALLSKLVRRQLPNITGKKKRHQGNRDVLTKHAQDKADFTQRATTLLNTSLSHDIHPTDPTHEDTDIDW
jgi:hypothetical protein